VVSGTVIGATVVVANVVSGVVGSEATVVAGGMMVASTGTLFGNPAIATPAPTESSPTMT
jgi:hypothetical protein